MPERTIYRHLRCKAMVHTVCHTQPVVTGTPAVFGRREKGGKMFIRSQNKTKLIPEGKYTFCVAKVLMGVGKPDRYAIEVDDTYSIGTYSTEERAIEVLGRIMEAIENEENTFQMPQELETVFTGTERKSRWKE